ncbi:MAG: hypothetical protein CMO01_02215 [Thalassobius sp.]|nr:hypothetical protein [Thalassovita sp.]
MGIKAVAAMGMASVIHHMSINAATAITLLASGLRESNSGNKRNVINKTGPATRPIFFDNGYLSSKFYLIYLLTEELSP